MQKPMLKLYNMMLDQLPTRCSSWRSINLSSSYSSVNDCINVTTTINDLPDRILVIIFQNLLIGDRFRARLVSKSWNRILSQGSSIPWAVKEAPWEIVSNDSYMNRDPTFITQILFRSMSEDRIYRFTPPESHRGVCCCGSSRGWILMSVAGESKFSPDHMFLWDPISGSTRRLPPLPITINEGQAQVESISCLIDRVQVFPAAPASDRDLDCPLLVVAVIYKQCPTSNGIALCSTRDETWTRYGDEEEDEFFYCDIMFHDRRNKLYVIAYQTLTGDKIVPERDTVDLPSCWVEIRFIRLDENAGGRVQDVTAATEVRRGFRIVERDHQVYRLVRDSSSDDVLVAIVNLDQVICGIDARDLMKLFECHQTRSVTIKSAKGDSDELEDVPSLGDQSVFLGAGSDSIAMKCNAKGIDSTDCVYLAIDDAEGSFTGDVGLFTVRERGVFHLKTKKMELKDFKNLKCFPLSKVGWFKPKLF